MKLPIQTEPIIRKVSTLKINNEYGVNVSERGTCWKKRGCRGQKLGFWDFNDCFERGGKSWSDRFGDCLT